MKLLVISHPAVLPVNQELFARIEVASGWQLSIVVPSRWRSEYGPRRPARSRHFRGRLIPTPVALSGNIPLHGYLTRLTRTIARERPDAIYVHHEPYGMATFQTFAANRRSTNVPIGFFSCQNLAKRYPWPFRSMERFVYEHASFAFPVSTAVAGVLRDKGYRGPLSVVPFAIDTDAYRNADSHHSRGDRMTLGYVGRLVAGKGVETLLTAIGGLAAERVGALIAGDGPMAPALKAMAARIGVDHRVTWAGYVPHEQVAEIYRRVDAVVVPSITTSRWKEQFGRVVIEALACGVPVVTSDSGELPQLVQSTGGGWTFPEGDAAALRRVLEQLLDRPDERRARGARGRLRVREEFDIRVASDRFVAGVRAACPVNERG